MKELDVQIADTLEQIKLFLPKLIDACEQVEKKFYESITESFWQEFGEIVEGMDDLYRTLNSVNSACSDTETWNGLLPRIEQAAQGISVKFGALNQCVDADDYVSASDTLKFELIPLFEQLATDLGEEEARLEHRFRENLKFLKAQFPQAYEEVRDAVADQSSYQLVYSRDGNPNLYLHSGDGKPVYLYSQFAPEEEALRWIKKIADKVQGKSEIILYGLGFGYHLKAFLELYPQHRVSVYEPNVQIFLAAMRVLDIEQLFERGNIADFVLGSNKDVRDRMFYRFLKFMKGQPEILELPVYYRINRAEMERFSTDAQLAILNYGGSVGMYVRYGWEWMCNSLYTLPATLSSPSIGELRNRYEGMTGVVVGAGPSLAEDIEVLRKMKDHALIIAAGSSIQSLLHYGIEPHLIVSMDGGEPNYRAFHGLDIGHIPLLYTPMIKYKIIDEKKEHLLHVHFTNDKVMRQLLQFREDDPLFVPNHSVTGTAIQAAIYLGCKEIVFTGQDLSYPGGQMYAPGARHLDQGSSEGVIGRALLTVENVQGGLNRTNNGMRTTLADIEDLLAEHSEVTFVNTSTMGAKIKHTHWEPMAAVLERNKTRAVQPDVVKIALSGLDGYDIERIEAACSRMLQLPDGVRLAKERLERIDRLIESVQLTSRTHPKKCFDAFEDIDKNWKLFLADIPFQALYFTLFRNQLNDFERDLPELAAETNWIRKATLARDIMQPLVRAMLGRTPAILNAAVEGARRIEVWMNERQRV